MIDESGIPGGVLVIVNEKTEQVRADRRGTEERERQRQMLSQMPGFVAVLLGRDHVFEYVNDAYVKIAGTRDFVGRSVREVFPELAGQGFYELLDQVYTSGTRFVAGALPIHLAGEEEGHFIDMLYEPTALEACG